MSDLKIQGEVSLDTSNADKAFGRVEQGASRMAQSVSQAGEQAAKAVDGIGNGGDASAKKVDAATKSMIQSIQRTTAMMEAGSKSNAKYYETLAMQRGVDVSALKPYLAQLDAVVSKQKAAEQALNATTPALNNVGVSAKQTAFAMRQIPMQMTDIVTSLISGQAPMTVLVQQGGQLKDVFGGIGPAARALGGYVAGLVNPFAIAAIAVGGLAFAAYKGREEFDALNSTLRMTGGYTGTTAKQVGDMAERIATSGTGVGQANEALKQLIATGKVGGDDLEKFGMAALGMAKSTGIGIDAAAKSLADLSDDAVKWAEKYNEQYHFMSSAQYLLAKQYADTGDKAGAAKVVVDALVETQRKMAEDGAKNVGALITWYNQWGVVIDKIKSGLTSIGKPDSNFDKINFALRERDQIEANMAAAEQRRDTVSAGRFKAQLDSNLALIASLRTVGDEERKRADENKKRAEDTDATIRVSKYLDSSKYANPTQQRALAVKEENKAFAEAITGFEKTSKQYEDALARHNANLTKIDEDFDKRAGGSNNTELANLKARIQAEQAYLEQLKTRGLEAEKLNEGEKKALELQEQLKGKLDAKTRAEKEALLLQANKEAGILREIDATKELLKSQDEFQKARDKEAMSLGAEIVKINEKAQAVEDEVAMYGLSRTAIDSLAIARLEEKRAALLQFEGSEERIALLDQEIEARKRLAAAMDAKDAKDEAKKSAEHAAAEWKRAFDDVERSLTDAIMRGGKNAGEYLRDYFRTLTLRPIIQAVMSPITGAVSSIFAPSTAMAGGAGGLGSTSSLLSAGKTLWDGFAGGFASFGNTAGQLSQFGLTSLSGGTAAVSTGMAGTGWVSSEGGSAYLGGGASTMGIAAGYAAGIGAGIGLGNLISGQYGSQFVTVAGTAAGAAIGAQIGAIGGPLGAVIGGVVGGLANRAFGMGPKKTQAFGIEGDFTAEDFYGRNFSDWKQKGGWFRSDKRGTDYSMLDPAVIGQFSDGVAALRSQTESFADALGLSADSVAGYSKHIRLTLTNDQAENQKLITQLFGSIGDEMAGMVGDLSAFARAGETAGVTLQRLATSITAANDWLSHLQQTLFETSVAGGDAASKLADAFGGLQNLATVSAAFYQAYYTEGERAARSREDMKKVLESVNLALPETMAEFRQMAASLDLTTESGRQAYVTLLSIAPEFANVAQATERAAKDAAGKLLAAFSPRGALVPAMQASGALNDEIYALGKNAADAVIDIEGLGDALAHVNTETFIETMTQVFDNLASRIRNVIGDITSERGAVREAALQILNPAGMSKEAIQAGIAGINTALPSNAGLAGLNADFALVNRLAAAQSAALSPYRAAQDALSNFRNTVAPSPLQNAQLVKMNGNVPGVNEALYASNGAYRQAWDDQLARHIDRFGTGYTRKSDAAALDQQLRDLLAPAIAAEKAAFEQSVQEQMARVDALQASYKNATDALVAAQTAAAEHAKAAQLSYADALQQFAIEAGQSVNKLSHLREETLKYYEAQKQLADLMTNSAAGLRKSLTDYRYNQLTPEDQFAVLRSQFASAYSMSLSTDGETLAGYADKLNGLINPLLDKAREVYGDGADYNAVFSAVFAQAQSIATRLETLTPTNYAADSLQLLEQIDATLAELETSTRSADELVVAAINASRDQMVGGLRAVIAAITGQTIPAFALGGAHAGGVRLVGENGPELEVTGPSRIYSASQTRDLLSGGSNEELVAEVRALRQQNADLQTAILAIATHTSNTARRLERIEADGMLVRTEDDSPLKTEVA